MSKRNCQTNFLISQENLDFIKKYGGFRKTSFSESRFNFSKIVNEKITEIRTNHNPDFVMLSLVKDREEKEVQIEEINKKAVEVSGRTIEDWYEEYANKENERMDELSSKKDTLKDLDKEMWEEICVDYSKFRKGENYDTYTNINWIKTRFREQLRQLGMTGMECYKLLNSKGDK